MSETLPVLIVGAGVAGLVLALNLHDAGYHVILFEKHIACPTAGASLNLAPNGLRVLDCLGLARPLFSRGIACPVETLSFKVGSSSLITSDLASKVEHYFGFPFAGVKRSIFLEYLLETVQVKNIQVRFGHRLLALQQTDKSVTAIFGNGEKVRGSFLIGCDGLHSQTRSLLFGDDAIDYTGLTQTAGMTLVPRRIRHLQNSYGDNMHLISYAVGIDTLDIAESGTHGDVTLVSWAITQHEDEAREDWNAENGDAFRANVVDAIPWDWDEGISAKELVDGAEKVIKFGLYDRKELKTWYKGRAVLVGDAAHPTGPHLGQGANQALEDVALLGSLLGSHVPPHSFSTGVSPSTAELETVFKEVDAQRIPRTSALVRQARAVGQQRVLPSGDHRAAQRDRDIVEEWSQDETALLERYKSLLGKA